ncbi:MlaD family protein [Motiliproteus sp. SC1-56]|uniref:MlaD family protein n=1 Tax=Motiliproteus sp. SC1-56 TaxID=2799565 RepID=UPI001A8D11A1|nr:MlaD family protein [Motiliproteus sp. SC1-56]
MNISLKILFAATVLFLAGCSEQNLSFTISYKDVSGLKKSAPLMYQGQTIGTVDEVIYTAQGDFQVRVSVAEPYRALATESALFVISDVPNQTDTRMIRLIASEKPGPLIQEDQLVQGSTALAGVAKELENTFGSALESLSSTMADSWASLSQPSAEPQAEKQTEQQAQQLQLELDKMLEEAKRLSDAAKARLKADVIPAMKQQIEALRKQLEQTAPDDSVDQAEDKLDELERRLET